LKAANSFPFFNWLIHTSWVSVTGSWRFLWVGWRIALKVV